MQKKALCFKTLMIMKSAFGLANILFLGFVIGTPLEISFYFQNLKQVWIYVLFSLFSIGFILFSNKLESLNINIIQYIEILHLIIVIFLVKKNLKFERNLSEPWFVRAAWFFRTHSILLAFFIAFTLLITASSMKEIFQLYAIQNNEKIEYKKNTKESMLTFVILVFAGIFLIILLNLYKNYGLYHYFILNLVFFTILLAPSFFGKIKTKPKVDEKDQKINPPSKIMEEDVKSIRARKKKEPDKSDYLKILFFGFLIVIVSLIGIEIEINNHEILLEQILCYALLTIFFCKLLISLIKKEAKIHGKNSLKTPKSLISINFFQIFAFSLVQSQIIYFFDFPLYFPSVLSKIVFLTILGAFLHFFLTLFFHSRLSSNKLKDTMVIMRIFAILLLLLNFYFIYRDGIDNSITLTSFKDGSFSTIFPFKYIHHYPYFILTGIPCGLIISDILSRFIIPKPNFREKSKNHFSLRIVFFITSLFIWPQFTLTLSTIINFPGAPTRDQKIFIYSLYHILSY